MSKTYITLTGTQYYHGKDFLKPGMRVQLVKEPDNKYDPNAVKVNIEIDNVKFFIGYVPTGWTQRVLGTIRRSNAGWIKIEVKGQLTGGKYKFSDLDDHIKTGKKNYGFIVTVYYENR